MAQIVIYLGTDSDELTRAGLRYMADHPTDQDAFWPEMPGELLHPSKHGELADQLLARSAPPARPVAVVTHSNVIVQRVRRRVAEGTYPAEAVEIRWVESDDRVVTIGLNERGEVSWWPAGLGHEAEEEYHHIISAQQRVLLGTRGPVPGPIRCDTPEDMVRSFGEEG